jgi:hypothetical protein
VRTLREVLSERHQAVEPKLDAIRERVIAGMTSPLRDRGTFAPQVGWRLFLWSTRWHLAGLGGAWVVVLLINFGHAPELAQAAPRRDAPSAQQLLAALRENQRQLRELIAAPASEPAPEPPKPNPSPRSQIQVSPTAAV